MHVWNSKREAYIICTCSLRAWRNSEYAIGLIPLNLARYEPDIHQINQINDTACWRLIRPKWTRILVKKGTAQHENIWMHVYGSLHCMFMPLYCVSFFIFNLKLEYRYLTRSLCYRSITSHQGMTPFIMLRSIQLHLQSTLGNLSQ